MQALSPAPPLPVRCAGCSAESRRGSPLPCFSSNRVLYDIRVPSGTEIDLYVVPQSGFVVYQDDASPLFAAYDLVENSLVIQGSFTGATGKGFCIVDTVDLRG